MKLEQKYIRAILLMLALSISSIICAQDNLSINSIFNKYGKQKGSTMVVMSGKALKEYKLNKYQSITISYDKYILKEIQDSIEKDKQGANKIKEVVNNGIVSSGYYQLSKDDETKDDDSLKRYILFKIGSEGRVTIIYIEGGLDSDKLIERLFLKPE